MQDLQKYFITQNKSINLITNQLNHINKQQLNIPQEKFQEIVQSIENSIKELQEPQVILEKIKANINTEQYQDQANEQHESLINIYNETNNKTKIKKANKKHTKVSNNFLYQILQQQELNINHTEYVQLIKYQLSIIQSLNERFVKNENQFEQLLDSLGLLVKLIYKNNVKISNLNQSSEEKPKQIIDQKEIALLWQIYQQILDGLLNIKTNNIVKNHSIQEIIQSTKNLLIKKSNLFKSDILCVMLLNKSHHEQLQYQFQKPENQLPEDRLLLSHISYWKDTKFNFK